MLAQCLALGRYSVSVLDGKFRNYFARPFPKSELGYLISFASSQSSRRNSASKGFVLDGSWISYPAVAVVTKNAWKETRVPSLTLGSLRIVNPIPPAS